MKEPRKSEEAVLRGMRGRRVLAIVLIGSCTVGAFACNLLNGVGDLETGAGGGDASPATTPTTEGGASDGGGGVDAAPAPPPTCGCVAAAPSSWSGPFALLEGAGPARACPTGLAAVLDGGADAGASSACAPCTCGGPVGSCATALVEVHRQDVCNNLCDVPHTIGTSCTTVKYCGPSSSATAVIAADSGTCAPSGGQRLPPSWGLGATACAFASPPDTTCPADQVCAPKSAGAPDARTCIVQAGVVACPPGPYTARVLYDTRITDTRSCSACTCDPAAGTCSTGTVSFYTDGTCGNLTMTVPTTGTCTMFNDPSPNGSAKLTVASQLVDGGCAPHGGQVTGGALGGADPTTLCCLP